MARQWIVVFFIRSISHARFSCSLNFIVENSSSHKFCKLCTICADYRIVIDSSSNDCLFNRAENLFVDVQPPRQWLSDDWIHFINCRLIINQSKFLDSHRVSFELVFPIIQALYWANIARQIVAWGFWENATNFHRCIWSVWQERKRGRCREWESQDMDKRWKTATYGSRKKGYGVGEKRNSQHPGEIERKDRGKLASFASHRGVTDIAHLVTSVRGKSGRIYQHIRTG